MSKKIYIKIPPPPPKKILKDWPKINKFVQHYLLCMWHTWKSSIQHGGVSKQGGQHRVPFSNGLPNYQPICFNIKTIRRVLRRKETFDDQLSSTVDNSENESISLIAGDFNAKIGKIREGDASTCLGRFSNLTRNNYNNVQTLLDLWEARRIFVPISAINDPVRHKTTWVGQMTYNIRGDTEHLQPS